MINPYAVTYVPQPELAPRDDIWVDGNCLVVPSKAVLPLRCVLTNQPIELADVKTRILQWAPSFRLVLSRDRCEIAYGLNRSYRLNAFMLRLVLTAIALGLIWMMFGFCAILFPLSIGLSIFLNPVNPLKVVRVSNGQFWISGCSQAFLDSLETESSSATLS